MDKHTQKEDIIAMLTGTFLVAQGVFFLQAGELLTGGTAGLALLMTHFLPWSFGWLYFMANSPFYLLAWRRFGGRFAINSALCGALVSIFTDHLAMFITLSEIDPFYCALAGGLLMGLGMLILFRHRASLGGFNVLCLAIQDRYAIPAGHVQMVIDGLILSASLFFISPSTVLLSIFGAIILNLVLSMNHKPTRYNVTYQP